MERGIIDENTGRYVNPLTGDSISIQDAVDRGFLDVEVNERKARDSTADTVDGPHTNGLKTDLNMNGPQSALTDNDLIVEEIRDPRTGKLLTLEEAIKRGIVDLENGVYRDPRTGKKISLVEAIQRGDLKVRLADPVNDMDNGNRLNFRVLKMNGHVPSMKSLVAPTNERWTRE